MAKDKRQTIFQRNEINEGYWRWFVDPVWHHCSSMYQEAHLTKAAKNDHERYHHLRACLYFSIGMVEAFLNRYKRAILEKETQDEEAIRKKMLCSFYEKTLWPFDSEPTAEIQKIREVLLDLNDMRAEVTHPRRKDHAIYRELDNACSYAIVEVATEYIVAVHEHLGIMFPYWLLGWNFIGVNNDETEAFPNPNAQFLYGLARLGFRVRPSDYGWNMAWQKENMSSLTGFRNLRNILEKYPKDVSPRIEYFLGVLTPRLTRRWWDRDFLLNN